MFDASLFNLFIANIFLNNFILVSETLFDIRPMTESEKEERRAECRVRKIQKTKSELDLYSNKNFPSSRVEMKGKVFSVSNNVMGFDRTALYECKFELLL